MRILSIIITIFAIFSGFVAKKQKSVSYVLLFLLFILIAFEYTLSGEGDYWVYEGLYDSIGSGYDWALVSYEPLFVLFMSVCHKLGLSLLAVKSLMAVIVLTLLYKSINTYTKNPAVVLSLFFIFPAFFDAELMRWLFAESIVIYGFKYLIRGQGFKDYVIYSLFIIIAALFHIGSFVFVFFLLAAVKNRRLLFVTIFFISLLAVVLKSVTPLYSFLNSLPFGDHLQEKYQTGYVGNTNALIMSTFRYMQALSIVIIALVFTKGRKIQKLPSATLSLSSELCDKIVALNIIMIIFIPFNLFSSQVQRFYHIMIFLNYIFLAVKCEEKKNVQLILFLGTLVSLSLLWIGYNESEGASVVFNSHFTVGYLIHMFRFLFGG